MKLALVVALAGCAPTVVVGHPTPAHRRIFATSTHPDLDRPVTGIATRYSSEDPPRWGYALENAWGDATGVYALTSPLFYGPAAQRVTARLGSAERARVWIASTDDSTTVDPVIDQVMSVADPVRDRRPKAVAAAFAATCADKPDEERNMYVAWRDDHLVIMLYDRILAVRDVPTTCAPEALDCYMVPTTPVIQPCGAHAVYEITIGADGGIVARRQIGPTGFRDWPRWLVNLY